jgi:SAM-dependent methyltransferase
MTSSTDSTQRFSNRVADYVNYRPRYPHGVVDFARDTLGLATDDAIADIGSGTGFLAEIFLQNGNIVYGVEPNREMREAGERLLAGYDRFHSVDATAEATTLGDASVRLVTAGQAFHWFDPEAARAEFRRILIPGGHVMLVWNQRRSATTPFLAAYEELLHAYGNDYENVGHRGHVTSDDSDLREFFAPDTMSIEIIPGQIQLFDFEGLKGRVLSSSYMPTAGHARFDAMVSALRDIFAAHQSNGHIRFEHDTMIYYGSLDKDCNN